MMTTKFQRAKVYLMLFLFCFSPLLSEIQTVTLQWDATQCTPECIQLLQRQLSQIEGVAAVQISQGLGQAVLTWKPNKPFSYEKIDYTFRLVGLANRTTHMRVRGTIVHTDSTVTLVSIGDFTAFKLLGALQPSTTQYVTAHNPLSYPLLPTTRSQLLEIEKKAQTVVIEGRLYDPYRYYFTQYLIIDKIDKPIN